LGDGRQRKSFDIPVCGASEMPELVMQAQSEGKPIVYVVDDDQDVREGLKALIESVGLRCQIFESTAEFLRNKRVDDVSCLILDVRLPGLGGLEFQAELSQAQIVTPIIFISGHGDIPMTVKAMKAGAVEFLTKPMREQDLLEAVRVALNRDSARRRENDRLRDLRTRYATLSPREREVIALVCSGLMNKQVAAKMGVSEVTVKVHRHNLMKKLGAKSLAELVRMEDSLKV
jgi:FixJ family two-component response regulator